MHERTRFINFAKHREVYKRRKGDRNMDETIIKNQETNNEEVETKEEVQETEEAEKKETPTVEELMAELAKERAEREKLKTSLNKASSDVAKYKKQLRTKQTAEEAAEEAKKEQEEARNQYVKDLEYKVKKNEAMARYANAGMDADLAEKTAEAELNGDMDTVNANYQKMMAAKIKAAEAEWIKSRPDIQTGSGEEKEEEDPFIKGFTGK